MLENEFLEWNCETEVNLFHAMRGHKPVGVNRHFQMVFILDKLMASYKKLTSKHVWDCLGELYDLQALNESEILPFPNKELDFSLPDTSDFTDLQNKSFPRLISPKLPEETKQDHKTDRHEKADSASSKATKSDTRHSTGSTVLQTPDSSPKRKRTRHTPSSTASPATPDAPPAKRRR